MFKVYSFFLLGWVTILASCASNSDGGVDYSEGISAVSGAESTLEKNVIYHVNLIRKQHGKNPISHHKGLSTMSRKHSDFMSKNEGKFSLVASNLTHYGFAGRSMLAGESFDVESVAENVIYTASKGNVAKHIVDSWYQSPSHKLVLIGDSYKYCGVGIRNKAGKVFGTMLMAEPLLNPLPMFVGPPQFR